VTSPFVEQRLGEPDEKPLFDKLGAMSDRINIHSILFQVIPVPVVNPIAAPNAELSNSKGQGSDQQARHL